jgi:hypothetical protein
MRQRHPSFIVRLVATITLLACSGFASAAGLRLHMWPTPPVYTGTSYSIGVLFEKVDRNDGIDYFGPFTFRTTLPAGMRFVSFQGGGWSCSAQPNLRDVTCIYSGTLTFWNPGSMSVGINALVDYGLTPGPLTLSGTIENAQLPLPPNVVCVIQPSDTGCANASTAIVTSKVQITGWGVSNGTVTAGPVAVWTGQPFEAGTQNVIMVETNNIGFGPVNTPVEIDVWLPGGISFVNVVSAIPSFTCQNQAAPGHVRCTTPYMYDSLNSYVSMRVQVPLSVPIPGPLFVHATVSNDKQVRPTDCVANPMQLGCARLQIPTRTPRVATLVTDGISHNPPTFTLGQEQGPLVIGYRNIGEASAGSSNIYIQLPPYFEYRGLLSSSPPATCAAQGAIASGQIVVCNTAGLPPFSIGSLSLRVYAGAQAASPGPLTVLSAVDLVTPANPALLQSCMANPAQSFCATHGIPTYFPCAAQWTDGIFCDGLQVFVRP